MRSKYTISCRETAECPAVEATCKLAFISKKAPVGSKLAEVVVYRQSSLIMRGILRIETKGDQVMFVNAGTSMQSSIIKWLVMSVEHERKKAS